MESSCSDQFVCEQTHTLNCTPHHQIEADGEETEEGLDGVVTRLQHCTCHTKLTQKVSLIKHMLTHSGETPHECETCHKKFTQERYLHSHMLTHELHPHRQIEADGEETEEGLDGVVTRLQHAIHLRCGTQPLLFLLYYSRA